MSEIESMPEEEKPEGIDAKEEEETLEEVIYEAEAHIEDTHGFKEAEAVEEMITVLSSDIAPVPIPLVDEEEIKRPQIEEELQVIPTSTPNPEFPELESEELGEVGEDEEDDKGVEEEDKAEGEGAEEDKEEEKNEQGSEEQLDL